MADEMKGVPRLQELEAVRFTACSRRGGIAMKPDYPTAIWRPAAPENYRQRPAGAVIDCVVLHATAGGLSGTLAWFANPASGVSAHYVMAKNGDVYQMVEEKDLAHHAGGSSYQGRT